MTGDVRTYGFLNLGRDKRDDRSTLKIDRAALTKLKNALPKTNAVAFLCEINEGDDDNELDLAIDVFGKGWRVFGERTHEPIFVTTEIAQSAMATVKFIKGTAVKHWSPQRSVLCVELDCDADNQLHDNQVLIATHPAAGPYTAGDRPDWARGPLKTSWHATMTQFLDTKREMRRYGRNVTSMCDLNRYDLRGLPGEVTVFHERTDYGRAWPRSDRIADFQAGPTLPVGLDSHGIHIMRGAYRRKPRLP